MIAKQPCNKIHCYCSDLYRKYLHRNYKIMSRISDKDQWREHVQRHLGVDLFPGKQETANATLC
jgi:hypothetical protein